MTTIHISPVVPILKERQRWFLTPTGDYYTVVPLTVEKALELIELGVRSVVVPLDQPEDPSKGEWFEAERLLFERGVSIRKIQSKEIRLTGS